MKQLLLSLLLMFALTSCQTEEEFETPEQQAETTDSVAEDTENKDEENKDEETNDDDDEKNNQNSQSNQNNEESGITKTLLTSIIIKNSWNLKSLTEKKGGVTDYINRTAKFSGFTFVFKDSGKVIAEADNTVIDGSWTITGDEKQGLLLMLDFNSNTSEFISLNNSWPIVSLSDRSMGFVLGELDITANKDNRVLLSFGIVN